MSRLPILGTIQNYASNHKKKKKNLKVQLQVEKVLNASQHTSLYGT